MEGTRDDQGGAAGALERNGFGDELAEHHVQDGEEHEGQCQSQAVREDDRAAAGKPVDQRAEHLRERRFAQSADAEAGQGDADLHAGDDPVELTEELLDDARARVAVLHELAHARDAHGNQGKFRGGEKRVDGHQGQHRQQPQTDHGPRFYQRQAAAGRRGLCRFSTVH